MRRTIRFGVFVVLALTAVGCSKEPTKEAAVETLNDFNTALQKKDYDKALTYVSAPEGVSPEKLKEELARFQDMTSEGIKALSEKGKWGKLSDVYSAEKVKSWTERHKVPADKCYGLHLAPAEAAFYWTGDGFKIIRMDDIHRAK